MVYRKRRGHTDRTEEDDHGAGEEKRRAAGAVDSDWGSSEVARPPILREAERSSRSGTVRSLGRESLPGALCEASRPAVDPARRLLPNALGGLLRRPRLPARDRLALPRQPLVVHLSRARPDGGITGAFQLDENSQTIADRGPRGGVRLRAEACRGEGPSEGQDHRGGLHDARGERGDEVDRAEGHWRGLQGLPQ